MSGQGELVPLFGEAVVVARPERAAARPGGMDQMAVWADAFEAWIGKLAPNSQRAYRKAWNDLLGYTGKAPWAVGKADVQHWVDEMRQQALSDCTIAQRVAGVSSFYEFVGNDYTMVRADGSETPLHTVNPAGGKRLRPKVSPYGKATHLGAQQVRALLRAIRPDDLQGLRDRALYLGYLMTMRRNSEWRTLRWGDIEDGGEKVYYRWSGKGKKDQKFEMPRPVWEAIRAYLKAAGRLERMQAGDYIFTALTDRATRLPNVNGATFDLNRPLSMREVGRLLKGYCRRAGINPKSIKVHSLRHTGAMGRKESGEKVEDISKDLAHSSLAVTTIYLQTVEGHQDDHWMGVANLWGVE